MKKAFSDYGQNAAGKHQNDALNGSEDYEQQMDWEHNWGRAMHKVTSTHPLTLWNKITSKGFRQNNAVKQD